MITAELHGIDIPVRALTGPELRELISAVDVPVLLRLVIQTVSAGFFVRAKLRKIFKQLPLRYLLELRTAVIAAQFGGTMDDISALDLMEREGDGIIYDGAQKISFSRIEKLREFEKYESYFALLAYIITRIAGGKDGNIKDFMIDFVPKKEGRKELTPGQKIAALGQSLGATVTDNRPRAWNMERIEL